MPLSMSTAISVAWVKDSAELRAYRLHEKRACNFHRDCTVGKTSIVAKNSDKIMCGRGQMEAVQLACQRYSSTCLLESWVSFSVA